MTDEPETKPGVKTALLFIMFFVLLGAIASFAYFATYSRTVTTVVLVRHAEKNTEPNNPDPHLSPAGQARAQELARILADAGINAIYATQYQRTQETVKPLADRLGLPVNVIDSKQTAELVKHLLLDHRSQTILVSGHDKTLPEIITAQGGPSLPVIPAAEFDNLYIVTVYRTGKAKVVKMKYGSPSQ